MLFSVLISFEFNMFWKNVKVHLGAGQQSIDLVTNLSLKVENTQVKVAFFFFRAVVLNLKSGVAEKYLRVVQEM